MTEALPKGIVTNTENISSEIEALDRVEIEDIAHLWRVYTTNRVVLEHDAGRRLENFFWRIWSNGRIHQNIRGSTLARLFLHISEGTGFIRTTPTQSPPGNRSSPAVRESASSSPTMRATAWNEHVAATQADTDLQSQRTTRQTSDPSKQTLPPPILKKPRSGSDDPPKTARIVSPKQTGVAFSWVPGQQPPTPPLPVADSSGGPKNGRKKTSFVANTASNRRRPSAPRRKSSQSSTTGTTLGKTSPRLQPETVAPFQPGPPSTASHSRDPEPSRAPAREANPLFSLSPPADSWQDADSLETSSMRVSLEGQAEQAQSFTGDQPVHWLVDRDFRSRFADRRLQEQSEMSFSSLGPSTPNVDSDGDETERVKDDDDEEDEDEDENENEEPPAALPRTKSQLSLMIDRERRSSEGSGKGKGKQQARKTSS